MITDSPEKIMIGEIIREKALDLLSDEIPHGIAVEVESMKMREDKELYDIDATIYCEKKSHKGIIIGKDGSMLKKIGERAREDIEKAGVDVSQVTGSASSYARKYALNGLFALDDGKDEDIHPTIDKVKEEAMASEFDEVKSLIKKCETPQQVVDLNEEHPNLQNYAPFVELRNNIYRTLKG